MFWFLRLEFISILRLRHHGRDVLSERLPRQCETTKLRDWNCQPWWESWPPDSWYWIICYQINFQELNWRGLLTIISPSGKRAGSPPGLSLISRDSDILRGLLNQILWWVITFREYFKFNQRNIFARFGGHQPILPWRMRLRVNQVRRVKLWVRPCGWRRVRANSV